MDGREELAIYCGLILTLYTEQYNIQKKKNHRQIIEY